MSNDILTSSQFRRSTRFELTFPTLPSITQPPRTVELYQEAYRHDVLKVKFNKFSNLWFKTLKTGTPVQFVWWQGTESKTWLGYVQGVKHNNVAGQKISMMEVTCIGSSFVLKQRSSETFSNKTIPEVAEIIAKKHKLQFVGENHSRRFSHLAISGQSYWEWLHQSALKIGYGMYVDGATLVFRPLDKLLDYVVNTAPVLSMTDQSLPAGNLYLDRTLDSLTVLSSDYVEQETNLRTKKIVGGVDPLTNKIYVTKENPSAVGVNLRVDASQVIFDQFDTSHVANSAASITEAAKASAQLSRFNIPAQATAQGNPQIQPFKPVLIQGTGDLTDGYWIVTYVHHIFSRVGEYQMELELMTDGTGINQVTPARSGTSTNGQALDLSGYVTNTQAQTRNVPVIGAKLVTKYPILKEGNNKYTLNPSYWEISYSGKEGCCK